MTRLQLPDREDWRVFWNKPEQATHLNYSDNKRMVEKPARKNKHVVAG